MRVALLAIFPQSYDFKETTCSFFSVLRHRPGLLWFVRLHRFWQLVRDVTDSSTRHQTSQVRPTRQLHCSIGTTLHLFSCAVSAWFVDASCGCSAAGVASSCLRTCEERCTTPSCHCSVAARIWSFESKLPKLSSPISFRKSLLALHGTYLLLTVIWAFIFLLSAFFLTPPAPVDDVDFDAQQFSAYLQPFFDSLFQLLKDVDECETKVSGGSISKFFWLLQ